MLKLSFITALCLSSWSAIGAESAVIPDENTAWDFGARALYLKPAYAGSGEYTFVAVNNTTGQYEDFNQNWAWGFFVEGAWHIRANNDINVNWYYFNNSANRSLSNDLDLIGAGIPAINAGTSYIAAQWNAVNLEFGQHIDVDKNKNMRFHGGLQYAQIKSETNVTGETLRNDAATFAHQSKPSYYGVGARAGMDVYYDWRYGLGIYANGAAGLLVGNSKISNFYTENTGRMNSNHATYTTIVPEIETKFGVKYEHSVAQGNVTLDAGWMWINYFNATLAIKSTASSTQSANAVNGDFGLQGFYLGLNWLGNIT